MKVRTNLIRRVFVTFTLLSLAATAFGQNGSSHQGPSSLVVQIHQGASINKLAAQFGFIINRALTTSGNGPTYVISGNNGNGDVNGLKQALSGSSSVSWVDLNYSVQVVPLDGSDTVLPLDGSDTVLPLDGSDTVLPLGPGISTVTTSTIQAALASVLKPLDGSDTVLPLDGSDTVLPLTGIQAAYKKVASLTVGSPALILQPAFGKVAYFGAVLNSTGKGVIIADLDTGVDTCHPALVGVVPYNFVPSEPQDPENCPTGATVPGPGYGHGTEVGSLLRVLAPAATVWSLRIFDSTGTADDATVYQATVWAVDHGADVINMSFGSTTNSQSLQNAISYAAAHGVFITGAAGNDNQGTVMYPAAIQPAVAVAATDLNDVKAAFSNYGFPIDVSAPGTNLVSAYPGNRWALVSGTSFASAMVSGEGALSLGAWANQHNSTLSLLLLNGDIAFGVDGIYGQNWQYFAKLGTGRINMWKALKLINPNISVPKQ